jgi:hypothetical protein
VGRLARSALGQVGKGATSSAATNPELAGYLRIEERELEAVGGLGESHAQSDARIALSLARRSAGIDGFMNRIAFFRRKTSPLI